MINPSLSFSVRRYAYGMALIPVGAMYALCYV